MRIKRKVLFILMAAVFMLSAIKPEAAAAFGGKKEFGVFVGLNPENMDRLRDYQTVVIDAAGFTKAQIRELHRNGQTVFSYLNIGSLESFRHYYKQFQRFTMDLYEGWPGEYWMDVSQKEWQEYVVSVLAGELWEKGVDGFFLDNADVYEVYPRETIFKGLLGIVKGLGQYQAGIIMNGGQAFIRRADREGDLEGLLYGVNQESVFTDINYKTGAFRKQEASTLVSYKKYLSYLKKRGLKVFITEYAGKNQKTLRKKITRYCRKKGYTLYISASRELN